MLNIRLGLISQFLFPSYSACLRCQTTWNLVHTHITYFCVEGIGGMFPLCEKCWSELSSEQRLPYYKQLLNSWGRRYAIKWECIKQEVLDEGH